MTGARVPDLVVAGAQKAGTTGLFRSLGATAGVSTPPQQETTFLHTGEPWADWSRRYVPGGFAAGTQLVIKLATLIYFPDSLARMHDLNPRARVVIALRHPVERLVSLHRYLVGQGLERRPLEDALRADALQPGSGYRLDTYSGGSGYACALASTAEVFPPDRVLVLTSDDAATPIGLRRLQEFAGLAAPIPVVRANESAPVRSVAFSRLLKQPAVRAAARTVVPAHLRESGRQAAGRLNRADGAPAPRAELSPGLRAELLRRHEPDVAAAERALGTDLDAWRR